MGSTSTLAPDLARHFIGEFRMARAEALRDAEGFQELLFCLERLGTALIGKIGDLGEYREPITQVARRSPLAESVTSRWRDLHVPFPRLYTLVQHARNDALHHGAFARNLTTHAVQLALVIEDALMSQLNRVADYMVRDPICAQPWHPISFLRQQMLASSFSYLPVYLEREAEPGWYLIADRTLAKYLSHPDTRKARLARRLDSAIAEDDLYKERALICYPEDSIASALDRFTGSPILVCRRDTPQEIVGILTAFDLL
jgi:hypothetical protein